MLTPLMGSHLPPMDPTCQSLTFFSFLFFTLIFFLRGAPRPAPCRSRPPAPGPPTRARAPPPRLLPRSPRRGPARRRYLPAPLLLGARARPLTAQQTEENGFAPFARFQRTKPTRISTEYSLLGPTQPTSNSIQTAIVMGPTQSSWLQPPTKHTARVYVFH